MYVRPNFTTKAALKRALKEGEEVTLFQPNDMFGVNDRIASSSGVEAIEGPHYPEPHRWYAQVEHENGRVVRVIS